MATPTLSPNDPRDFQNIVAYVQPAPKEQEAEAMTFVCLPLVLGAVVFQLHFLFYVCFLLIFASWVSAKYGEFNFQQYSSVIMMCVMGFTMPLLQQTGRRPAAPTAAPPAPPAA
ncbi:family UPF0139 protein [Toxoplasma gondii GAB2-2007-GAL-DOM2]|uniref:Family UPF0139 protein n=7 Tax=Toxoplasma gondii TaxID=5811 RepID=A0A125YKC4_TOXGV|nr:hypothetical protein TGGT1_209120 [Toxoplasma gondii GT1]ESS29457.1 family UPF0139 protein [Toxoplasma gondii VEG]KFG34904.1 family UPF0139 protein [Toxoplasma gondii GAB2-2007-GAL-DOM2]KFH05565.1 family UPF0139 protein [Toxoplasma gondii VAND]KYF41298.1 family UPF0139 protein [Toxoplasma gondii ARI]RQX69426.1 family UPF0139 protein [Toxoplasma gondii CAST]